MSEDVKEGLEPHEEWRSVVGYEGRYEVSSLGHVRSLKGGHRRGKLLKPCTDSDGYYIVGLSKPDASGKSIARTLKVHRLVAMAFIPNKLGLPQVDHINGIKIDNRVENLRWASAYDNRNNPVTRDNSRASLLAYYGSERHRTGLKKVAAIMRSKYAKHVLDTLTNTIYASIHDASKFTGIGRKEISLSCKRHAINDYHPHKINKVPVKNRFHYVSSEVYNQTHKE